MPHRFTCWNPHVQLISNLVFAAELFVITAQEVTLITFFSPPKTQYKLSNTTVWYILNMLFESGTQQANKQVCSRPSPQEKNSTPSFPTCLAMLTLGLLAYKIIIFGPSVFVWLHFPPRHWEYVRCYVTPYWLPVLIKILIKVFYGPRFTCDNSTERRRDSPS